MSTEGEERGFELPSYIPLAMPSGSAQAMSIAAPEPLVDAGLESSVRLRAPVIDDEDEADEEAPPLTRRRAQARWGVPHYIIAVSVVVCIVSFGLALLRDRARDGELFRTAQAKRARAAVTAMAEPAKPPPPPPAESVAAPAPAPELAAIAAASASESAKTERFEAQVALEIGDVVRAERVAEHAVAHDPAEADGWLLLTAAQLELNQVEASRASLRSCADKATRGPHWECVALMRDNGPN